MENAYFLAAYDLLEFSYVIFSNDALSMVGLVVSTVLTIEPWASLVISNETEENVQFRELTIIIPLFPD